MSKDFRLTEINVLTGGNEENEFLQKLRLIERKGQKIEFPFKIT